MNSSNNMDIKNSSNNTKKTKGMEDYYTICNRNLQLYLTSIKDTKITVRSSDEIQNSRTQSSTTSNKLTNKEKEKSYTLITINSVCLNKAINPLTWICSELSSGGSRNIF
jgi:hypothetical protein